MTFKFYNKYFLINEQVVTRKQYAAIYSYHIVYVTLGKQVASGFIWWHSKNVYGLFDYAAIQYFLYKEYI